MVTTAHYKSGEVIIRENDQGETAYVIESGRVEVTKDLQGKLFTLRTFTRAKPSAK